MGFIPPFLVPPAPSVPRPLFDLGGHELNLAALGILPDGRVVIDAVTTSGSPIVQSAAADFTDLDIGHGLGVRLPNSVSWNGTILAVSPDGTQATLDSNAPANGTARLCYIDGTLWDARLAIADALSVVLDVPLFAPAGDYGSYYTLGDTWRKSAATALVGGGKVEGTTSNLVVAARSGAIFRNSVLADFSTKPVIHIYSDDLTEEATQAATIHIENICIDPPVTNRAHGCLRIENWAGATLTRLRLKHAAKGALHLLRTANDAAHVSTTGVGFQMGLVDCYFSDSRNGISCEGSAGLAWVGARNCVIRTTTGWAILAEDWGMRLKWSDGFIGGVNGIASMAGNGNTNILSTWGLVSFDTVDMENVRQLRSGTTAASTGATAVSGQPTLTIPTGTFSDSDTGRPFVLGALTTTILSVQDDTHITLAANALATGSLDWSMTGGTWIKLRDGVKVEFRAAAITNTSALYGGDTGIDAANCRSGALDLWISLANTDAAFTAIKLASTATGFTGNVYFSGTLGSRTLLSDAATPGLNAVTTHLNSPVSLTRETMADILHMKEVTFTETTGAGVYTGSVVVPAGAWIQDIKLVSTALWTATTSATMKVGDVADDDGWYTAIDLKATDLLVGEEISFDQPGGKQGAYLDNATGKRSAAYSASARTISGIVTTVGAAGSAGRTRMAVFYAVPSLAAVAATKV